MAKKRKNGSVPGLAQALAAVSTTTETLESRADNVLAIVRTAGIRELKVFNAAVREAYKANGWNQGAGKPKKGNGATDVPNTVKQYVSRIRAAFRLGLNVVGMKSFHSLRAAVAAAAEARRPRAVRTPKELTGLRITQDDKLTGAPFHDLVALYEHLERAKRPALVTAVQKVIKQFQPAAKPSLTLIAKAA